MLRLSRRRSMVGMVRTTGAAMLAGLLVCSATVDAADYRDFFEYVSPRPSAAHLPISSTLILRPQAAYAGANWRESVVLTGTRTGRHTGQWVLADDSRTWIFKPHRKFAPGETVTVFVGIAHGVSYRFTVSEQSEPPQRTFRFVTDSEERHVVLPKRGRAHPKSSQNPAAVPRSASSLVLPSDFPAVTVTVNENPDGGDIFVSPITFSRGPTIAHYLMILDNTGFPKFFRKLAARAFDFKKQPNGVITYYHNTKFWLMDSTYTEIGTVQAGNGFPTDLHEFVVLPNGHALLMIYDSQVVDMSQVVAGGDSAATVVGLVIQELDAANNVVFQWRSWDHFDILDTYVDVTADRVDYAHGNAIEPDSDGNLLISSRHMNEITKIDRQSGDIIWRMGGKNNEFTLSGDDQWFTYQHDIRRLPNGNITLFDNGNMNQPQESRAVEYMLDEVAMTVTLVWEYRDPEGIYGSAMGNAQRLSNGNTLINWGATNPNVTEVDRSGVGSFEMTFETDVFTYRAFRAPWEGVAAAPTLWANKDSTGVVTLYLTKFGDDSVMRYYIYEDDSPNPTVRVDSMANNSIVVSDLARSGQVSYFRATALDSRLNESPFSNEIQVDLKILVSTLESRYEHDHVSLTWSLRDSSEVTGFNVYRSEDAEAFVRLTSDLLAPEVRTFVDAQVARGRTYSYRLSARDPDGDFFSQVSTVRIPPGPFALRQNYPNPFNPTTTIAFHLPSSEHVKLVVYDAAGRYVTTLVDELRNSGDNAIQWGGVDADGRRVSSGVYFYQLSTQNNTSARKLMVLK